MGTDFNDRFVAVLEEVFPDITYEWHGQTYNAEQIIKDNGLMPLILKQAVAIGRGMPEEFGLSDVKFAPSEDSMTGEASQIGEEASQAVLLYLSLDAVILARKLGARMKDGQVATIILDHLDNPAPLANSPDEMLTGKTTVGPVQTEEEETEETEGFHTI